MMMKQFLIVVPVAIMALAGSICLAQTDATESDSFLNSIEAEFRELVLSRAADFTDPNQESAIEFAKQRNETDERFDVVVRKVLWGAKKPEHWDVEKITRAVDLMPLSTLAEKEQAEMLFECFLKCDTGRSDYKLQRELQKRLAIYPDQTSRLLKQRMSSGDYPPWVLRLVPIVGESSEALLPMLLEAAKSEDPEIAGSAMGRVDDLIARLRKRNAQKLSAKEMQALGVAGLDPKMIGYSKRIIQRYDTNGDLELSPAESAKMLMSPAAADANQDGQITVSEYAAFIQNRSKR